MIDEFELLIEDIDLTIVGKHEQESIFIWESTVYNVFGLPFDRDIV